jgi:two-component system OmpR family response regulator
MQVEQQKRVLVADGDDDIRRMIEVALLERDLVVDQARNGEEALSLLRGNHYAVVILDLLMPGTDGFGVLDGLNAPGFPPPPVVLVVTAADGATIEKLDPHRVHGIVRKPFDAVELASVVVACAEIRGRSPFETMALATIIGGPLLKILGGS